MSIVYLILGLACILVGASLLTDGSSALAKRYGISDLVIGLTIVAFGTSAPELVISVLSAIRGSAGLAIGNVVGSNIFNILAIIGVVALLRPIKVERSIMTNEIPLVLLSSLALLVCGNGMFLDNASENIINRTGGLLLLLFFLIFMRYTFSIAKNGPDGGGNDSAEVKQMPLWRSSLFILVGLAGLVGGGELFVNGATAIARSLNVSDAVIGLTIVAMSTSFPELATSAVAAVKGKPGLAIGNVIGSCLFNVFFVLGTSASISPLPLGTIGNFDLLTLVGASLLFWIFGWFFRERTITRPEGAILLLAYIAYSTILVINA